MAIPESPRNPYPGPRPFLPSEAAIFAGREDEISKLSSLVIAHRAVLLYAKSGAGKSSLINAGIIPALQEDDIECLPVVRVGIPADRTSAAADVDNWFAFSAVSSLLPNLDPEWRKHASLVAALARLPHAVDSSGDPRTRVLIFDQFEEIFSRAPERWEDRGRFFEQLRDALTMHRNLRVLMVLREDWLASFVELAHLLPDGARTRFHLDGMRQPEALTAITRPLEGGPHRFEEGVAEALARDLAAITVVDDTGKPTNLAGEFVNLVQLQVVCYGLLCRLPRDRSSITHDDLRAFGDVDGALLRFYEEALHAAAQATNVSERALRRWFEKQLITPARTRGLVFQGPAHTAGIPNQAVDVLASFHLIRPERRAGALWYELSHDRFLRPIARSNAEWRQRHAAHGTSLVESVSQALQDNHVLPPKLSGLVSSAFDVLQPALHRVTKLRALGASSAGEGVRRSTLPAPMLQAQQVASARRLGIGFTGTGARAMFEAGVLARLREDPRFEEPHVVTGVSHGAINAALFSAGKSPDAMRAFWLSLSARFAAQRGIGEDLRDLMALFTDAARIPAATLELLSRRANGAGGSGLLANLRAALGEAWTAQRREVFSRLARLSAEGQDARLRILRAALVEAFGGKVVPSSACRLCLAAVDAQTGEELRFVSEAPRYRGRSGRYSIARAITVDMVLASVSIPLLSAPVAISGKRLWNGGAVASTPLAPLLAFGADDLLMLLAARAPEPVPDMDGAAGVERVLGLLMESSYNVDRRRLHACNRLISSGSYVSERDYRDVNLYEALRPDTAAELRFDAALDQPPLALERMYAHGVSRADSWLAQGPRSDYVERESADPPPLLHEALARSTSWGEELDAALVAPDVH